MDRLTRKELKTDKFALEVGHGVEYVAEHKQQMIRYGAIAAGVLVLIIAIFAYRSYQNGVREDALRNAIRVQDALVGQPATESLLAFPTQEEKDKALQKAMAEVASKHPGTDQGSIARYFLGTYAADKGDLTGAEKALKDVIENGPANYASLAKLALGPVYKAQGKPAEGEKILRDLMANPTMFVSKEQATIALAQLLANSNPQEARKLIEPLREMRGPVSRAALTALAEIPQK